MAAQDRIPYTPLVVAASGNHTETVALLLDRGADIEDLAMKQRTALEWAACFGRVDTVLLPLGRGAEATETALRCAERHAWRGEEERGRYGRMAEALRSALGRDAA
ncbi:ankyrin repeat domain-containing protein [Streptomyces sp. NPDC054844]